MSVHIKLNYKSIIINILTRYVNKFIFVMGLLNLVFSTILCIYNLKCENRDGFNLKSIYTQLLYGD